MVTSVLQVPPNVVELDTISEAKLLFVFCVINELSFRQRVRVKARGCKSSTKPNSTMVLIDVGNSRALCDLPLLPEVADAPEENVPV